MYQTTFQTPWGTIQTFTWNGVGTDVILRVFSSVNNDLSIYLFATGVGCDSRWVGTPELNNISYISARATYTINFSVKKPRCSD